jgi:hypothetical protein
MSIDSDDYTTAELLAKIAEEADGLRGDLEGHRENDAEWETITRPLVSPADFHRFAKASRAIGLAHHEMLDTGQGDWLEGNPVAPLLYRSERGAPHSSIANYHAAKQAVEDVVDEAVYAIIRLHDAALKLPRKPFAEEHDVMGQCTLALVAAVSMLRAATGGTFDLKALTEALAELAPAKPAEKA